MSKEFSIKTVTPFWSTPGVEIQVVTVGARGTDERSHLDPVKESVVLAMMESAGMLATVEENLLSLMDEAMDQMSPEDLAKRRDEFVQRIHEGRHDTFVRLDAKSLALLERAARGDVVLVKGGKRRH